MKSIYIAIAGFIAGCVLCLLFFSSSRHIQAQNLSSAGTATIVIGKVAGTDAVILYDSLLKRLLIYKLLAGQIVFWTGRSIETDIQCEKFGNTTPAFDEVKRACKLEEKKEK
ncbi:MAG: hypothetical protein ACK4NF_04590, partial [Planctomycetota bacterium]